MSLGRPGCRASTSKSAPRSGTTGGSGRSGGSRGPGGVYILPHPTYLPYLAYPNSPDQKRLASARRTAPRRAFAAPLRIRIPGDPRGYKRRVPAACHAIDVGEPRLARPRRSWRRDALTHQRRLIRLDLPTFERPTSAISASPSRGRSFAPHGASNEARLDLHGI